MASDDDRLAERIRSHIPADLQPREQRMFGGRAFLVADRIAVAIVTGGEVIVRLGPQEAGRRIAAGEAAPVSMGERTMRGWVKVAPDDDLGDWVRAGVAHVLTLTAS